MIARRYLVYSNASTAQHSIVIARIRTRKGVFSLKTLGKNKVQKPQDPLQAPFRLMKIK